MAWIDQKTGDVVVRLAFDGASSAGKTTNLQRLHTQLLSARHGELVSPETTGRETAFFDWREFDGGYVDGRRLRVQIISLPGQPSRLHRRRHLLGLADGVVFVVDADPARHDVNVAMARELRAVQSWRDFALVVQQNKVDVGRLEPVAVLDALALPKDTPVIDATAADDVGVIRTFLALSQLVTARVREDLAVGTLAVVDGIADAGQLHEQLRALDSASRPPIPSLEDLVEVWPEASSSMAATAFALALPTVRAAWTSPESQTWQGGGHVIETQPSWSCETEADAGVVFDEVVAQQRRWKLDDSRVVALCREAGFCRVWVITVDQPTWPPTAVN